MEYCSFAGNPAVVDVQALGVIATHSPGMGGYVCKGTKPERDLTAEEVAIIDSTLFSSYEQLVEDSMQGLFKDLMPYTTSTNMELNDIGTAQTFVLFHDGLHIGSILALAKLV